MRGKSRLATDWSSGAGREKWKENDGAKWGLCWPRPARLRDAKRGDALPPLCAALLIGGAGGHSGGRTSCGTSFASRRAHSLLVTVRNGTSTSARPAPPRPCSFLARPRATLSSRFSHGAPPPAIKASRRCAPPRLGGVSAGNLPRPGPRRRNLSPGRVTRSDEPRSAPGRALCGVRKAARRKARVMAPPAQPSAAQRPHHARRSFCHRSLQGPRQGQQRESGSATFSTHRAASARAARRVHPTRPHDLGLGHDLAHGVRGLAEVQVVRKVTLNLAMIFKYCGTVEALQSQTLPFFLLQIFFVTKTKEKCI